MANLISFPIYSTIPIRNRPVLIQNKNCFVDGKKKFGIINDRISCRRRSRSVTLSNQKRSVSGEEDKDEALETVLKLYSAIKKRNIHQLSNIIGDECRCVCNFFSFFQSFQGKQQVVEFLKHMIQVLGNNIEFVVKPVAQDGMNIGVSWKLQWSQTHMPLGKGISFYILQAYHGKLVIRNMEMILEPILHIQPFRLKITRYATSIAEKLSTIILSKAKRKNIIITSLLLIATILVFICINPF